jgi:methyl-accepting chemotaxis protein
MPALLRPVLAVADRLRTSARLGTLTAVLLVPTVLAVAGFVHGVNTDVTFTLDERAGVAVVTPALDALAAVAHGEDPDLGALEQAVAAHPGLELDEALAAVRSAADPVARATALQALVGAAGDSSNLILDPDLDSFYVMDVLVVQLPRLLAAAVQQGAPTATGAERVAAQAVLAGTIAGAAAGVSSDAATSCRTTHDAALCDELGPLAAVSDAGAALTSALLADLEADSGSDAGAVASAVASAVAPTTAALDRLLATRAAGFEKQRTLMLAATAVFIVLAVWFAAGVWWRTRHDVRLTLDAVTALAAGDLAERPLPATRDELGQVGRALTTARTEMAHQRDELEAAQADRTHRMQAAFLQQREAERQSRERAQQIVQETSGAVVGQLGDVVERVHSVHDAASAIEEGVASSAAATAEVVSRAQHADSLVGALSESLRSVAGIVAVINGVADQTKLLALNATIEAARAGDAGRGFAIVASEVKDLAAETASSTAQITQIIGTLEQDAAAVSGAIVEMSTGVAAADAATADLHRVAERQYTLVADLDDTLGETIERIESMSHLADQLERRRTERVPTPGMSAVIEVSGRLVEVEVNDMSEGGCRMVGQLPVLRTDQLLSFALHADAGEIAREARVVEATRVEDGVQLRVEFLGPASTNSAVAAEVRRRLQATA